MWGAIAGAVGGGILGYIQNWQNNRANMRASDRANTTNIALNEKAIRAQREQSRLDRRMQKEFAQHGVSWKAEDARKAGLDPLAAMGSTTMYSPTGQPVQAASVNPSRSNSSAPYIQKMGQDLGSAIDRFLTKDQRAAEQEGIALDNRYKEIRNMAAFDDLVNKQTQAPVAAPSANPDSFPIAGQTDSAVKVMPAEVTIGKHRGKTAGTHHFGTDYVDDDGYLWEVPSEKVAESIESDAPSKIRHTIIQGGKYVKGLFVKPDKPKTKPRKGYTWRYDKIRGQWQEVQIGSHSGTHINKQYWDKKGKSRHKKIYKGKIHY